MVKENGAHRQASALGATDFAKKLAPEWQNCTQDISLAGSECLDHSQNVL